MKAQLIAEIEAIYRDHHYRPRGKALGDYSEEQLRAHLKKLEAGAYGWMQGKTPPSPQPSPAGGRGGKRGGGTAMTPTCAISQTDPVALS